MADSGLFMECEEEELEPWQQVDDNVLEEDVAVEECKAAAGSPAKVASAGPSSQAAAAHPAGRASPLPPAETPEAPPPPVSAATGGSSASPSSEGKRATDSGLTNGTPPVTAPPPPATSPAGVPPASPPAVPPLVAPTAPQLDPGQKLVLTQSPGPLGAVAVPQVLHPVPMVSSASPGNGPPIFLTTTSQGFQVQNAVASQVGFLLNGQPVTFLPAPGTQFFSSAVAQALSQQAVGQPGTTSANQNRLSKSFTVQIPATITIPVAKPDAKPAPVFAVPKMAEKLPFNQEVKLIKVVNVTGPSFKTQPKTPKVVAGNGKAPVKGMPPAPPVGAKAVSLKSLPTNRMCPRCGAQYRLVESLRGHVCFCSPELTQGLRAMGVAGASNVRPVPPAMLAPSKLATPNAGPRTLALATPKRAAVPGASAGLAVPSRPDEGEVDNLGKLIMLVDDFYYGQDEGQGVLESWDPGQQGPMQFRCLNCDKRLKSNIRLMNHMKHHIDLEQQSGEVDTHTSCQHCYRQFPTPFRLQCHLESVHSQYESTTKCKICEWAFENEPVFLQHMKNSHQPGEMPYMCQVCEYRSSFYSDVFVHFRTWHKETASMLCPYCLKVFRNSSNYQSHYLRHQNKTVFNCDKCRLQFLCSKDRLEHKVQQHKSFRKPRQLEGLKPGTKVTIRAYAIQNKPVGIVCTNVLGAAAIKPEPSARAIETPATPAHTSRDHSKKQPTAKRRPMCNMQDLLNKFQEGRETLGQQSCLECTFDIPDFSNHYPTYVNCSLCHYRTCCSRAYANHMINNHVSRKTSTKYLALYKAGPRWPELTCMACSFSTQVGDQMAKHLAKNPDHCSSRCPLKGPPTRGQKSESLTPERASVTDGGSAAEDPEKPREAPLAQALPVSSRVLPLPVPVSPGAVTDGDGAPEEGPGGAADGTGPRGSLTKGQLRVLLFALCCGVPRAAGRFGTKPRTIWAWLLERERGLEGGAGRDEGEAADQLMDWLLCRREQQRPVHNRNLIAQAARLFRDGDGRPRAVSHEWAVDFLLRRGLGLHAAGTAGRPLSAQAEGSSRTFARSVCELLRAHGLPLSAVGAVDELSVFLEAGPLAGAGNGAALQLAGTSPPLCDVFLSALADGTLLPALVFFRGRVPDGLDARLPCHVLLEAGPEGLSEVEQLKLWVSRVWRKGAAAVGGADALLVMDGFRGHVSGAFQAALNGAGTLTALVPRGCSCRLQPLEMCAGPALRGFLEARWSRLAAEGGPGAATPTDLLQLVLAWLAEALEALGGMPDLLCRSFRAAGVIPVRGDDAGPAEMQRELVRALTEALMGPKALNPALSGQEEEEEEEEEDRVETRTTEEEEGVDDGEKQAALNTSAESSAPSPRWPPLTANPQALRHVFEKDSDAESFLGFEESEIATVIGQ